MAVVHGDLGKAATMGQAWTTTAAMINRTGVMLRRPGAQSTDDIHCDAIDGGKREGALRAGADRADDADKHDRCVSLRSID